MKKTLAMLMTATMVLSMGVAQAQQRMGTASRCKTTS